MGFSVVGGLRQKFTSKERDNETGLDYFGARYYASTQGRFTSPDEFKAGPEELFGEVDPHDPLFYSDIAEPQSLNKYQYCLNNPLRYIDPDGHQTTTADALKVGATLTIAAPHPVAKGVGVIILVGVAVEVTIGWDNVGSGAKGVLDWASSGNTAGDASCPACTSSQKMGQSLMENGNNSQGGSQGSSTQKGRGSQNPNTAEAAKEGREQHKDFAEKVKAKPGWKSEPTVKDPTTGKAVKPDAVSPGGRPVELKPNTPTGRAQGRRQLPGQERATGKRGRVVYYEPKRKKQESQ
jgi:RHS repeat-associated protein